MLSEHNYPQVSAIIAAHPDDEVLWFSSILADAGKVILCFEDVPGNRRWSEGRRASLAEYPLPQLVNLALTEADVFHAIDWSGPIPSDEGLAIPGDDAARKAYSQNFGHLVERLTEELAGCRNVFTHSPWGEYGNAEHIQVFRAVATAVDQSECRIWVPGYVSSKTAGLMAASEDQLGCDVLTLPTNQTLAYDIAAIYKANQCWTWYADYQWPAQESFRAIDQEPAAAGTVWSVNHVRIDTPSPPKQKPGFAMRAKRKLRRIVGSAERDRGT